MQTVGKRTLVADSRCLLSQVLWEESIGIVIIEAIACGTPVAVCGGAVCDIVVEAARNVAIRHMAIRQVVKSVEQQHNHVSTVDQRASA